MAVYVNIKAMGSFIPMRSLIGIDLDHEHTNFHSIMFCRLKQSLEPQVPSNLRTKFW
jgi:hypothetical protein